MNLRPFQALAVIAAGTLGASIIVATPALATTDFTSNTLQDGMSLPSCSGFSTTSSTGATSAPTPGTITPNGPAVTTSWAGTNKLSDSSTPTPNTATQAWSMKSTAQVTASGGLPKMISVSWAGSYSVTGGPSTMNCSGYLDLYTENKFNFTTTQPLLVTLAYHKTTASYAETYIENSTDNNVYEDVYGSGWSGGQTDTFYLPAGSYKGYVEGDLFKNPASTGSLSSSGWAKMTFAVPGSAIAGPSGTAAPYVTMSHGRTCSAASLKTNITTNLTRKRRISKVVYVSNGRVVRTVYARALRVGMVINFLHLPATATERARVVVYLKNGARLVESGTYRPCMV